MKKNKGITLIALVVTLVILLVLAGITIAALRGENGLLSKTKQAREKYSISEAKEKLTTKLMQLQTEVTDEEQRSATIEDINKLVDENSKYYDKEIESVKDRNENKLVKISGYYFEVDSKLNIVGNIDATELTVTDATYKVNSTNGNIMNVTVNIKNEIGIQKVIKPDNTDVTPAGTKEQAAINYDVEDGKEYKFKVQLIGSNEHKEYTLKANLNAKPEIKQNESNAYPLLTKYGVEINKTVKIDYGESTNNYYSLDNGNSWIKYTEDGVSVKKEGKILAKSVINGEITKETQENITMQLADDALGLKSYDKDDTTYEIGLNKCALISNKLYGKTIDIHLQCPAYNHIFIKFYKADKTTEIGEGGYWHTNNGNGTISLTIPENASWLKFVTAQGYSDLCYIYEVKLNTKPVGDESHLYPYIDDIGVHNDYKYKISYFYTAVKKLYSKDNKNWIEYPQNGVTIGNGETVYAKSIDIKGNESDVLTYTNNISNLIGEEAYDGDNSTAFECLANISPYYMYIDPNIQNKEVYLKFTARKYSEWHFNFYNNKGEKIDSWPTVIAPWDEGYQDGNLIIPDGATKLEIIYTGGNGANGSFYEMKVIKN